MSRSALPVGRQPANKSKPPQGERVILWIKDEDCPVIGWWNGWWEVCTVNLYACGEEIEPAFQDENVEFWEALPAARGSEAPR